MKRIYISLPITGHEDTYESRLKRAVKTAERFAIRECYNIEDCGGFEIVTPKDVAYSVEDRMKSPKYTDYLLACLETITNCDIVFACHGYLESRGCNIEVFFALNMNIKVVYEDIVENYIL